MSVESLQPLLAPRSIAVIGASENPNKIGGRPLAYLKRFGFNGPVFAINPTRAEVQGFKCLPSLDALPEVPDVVVVAVPGDNAVAAVEACAKKGVKGVVCMTSGFGETSDPEGGSHEFWSSRKDCAESDGDALAKSGGNSSWGMGKRSALTT